MKQRRYHKKTQRREPSGFAWLALGVAWICVLPLTAFIFSPKIKSELNAQSVFLTATGQAEKQSTVQAENDRPEAAVPSFDCLFETIPAVQTLRSDNPTILIYHTHTTEAYTQTETDKYKEAGEWRTKDNTKNIVAVGEVLKNILEKDYGFTVIHDITDHEPPKLATAYDRSLVTMEKYHSEYPSIVLFIDLHRDAYTTDSAPCDFLTINGTETAKLMLVVGKGEKYSDKPYYTSNIAFANRITTHLKSIDPKLCRPIREKTGRYNQHVAPNCILVEVGHNANTLAQAKAAMPYLAESIAYSFQPGHISPGDWVSN